MRRILTNSAIIFMFCSCNAVIIPDELPSILSVIYSNIPTIMKGTDSRLGWGFRFGDRADFQVLVELGPQKNTQPLANEQENKNSKRNVPHNLINTLYAQKFKMRENAQKGKIPESDVISDTEGGKWLESWSKSLVEKKQPDIINHDTAKPGLAIGEIDAKSVIPEDDDKKETPSTTMTTKTTTTYKDALDNVDVDEP